MLKRLDIAEMMRSRRTLLLAVTGGVLGLAASVTAYLYLEREEAQFRNKVRGEQARDQVGVVVAKADLPAGTALSAGNMATRQVPRDYVYPDTVLPSDFDSSVSGQSLVKPLGKGQPLLRGYLSEGGAAGLADRVKSGRRAVAINVDEVSSLNGLIMPGDRIDLLMSQRSGGMVIPLLQGAKVLATGAQTAPRVTGQQPGDDKFGLRYATLTLDVTAEEAEKVVLARGSGTLSAILRGRGAEAEPGTLRTMQVEDLYATAVRQEQTLGPTVTYILRGGQPPGVANIFQVPIGLAMPSSMMGGEAASRPKGERGTDYKTGERDKQ
jgi:pilus assembly protein CpaB